MRAKIYSPDLKEKTVAGGDRLSLSRPRGSAKALYDIGRTDKECTPKGHMPKECTPKERTPKERTPTECRPMEDTPLERTLYEGQFDARLYT